MEGLFEKLLAFSPKFLRFPEAGAEVANLFSSSIILDLEGDIVVTPRECE